MENDKLVRLSDVIETVENQCTDGNMWGDDNLTLIDAHKTIDELSDIPAVDAVEVVRCRECKYNPKYEWTGCPMAGTWQEFNYNGFCHQGQSREDGDA